MQSMGHPGGDAIELIAALVLVIGGAIFVAISIRTRAAGARPTVSSADARESAGSNLPTVRRSLVVVMAGLSTGAAIIHVTAAPGHVAEIGGLALGFVIAAAFQFIWTCWCLAGPSRRTIAIGVAGNLAIVAAWTWSRTVGLPLGESAGSAEPIGYPDALSVGFELLLVGGLIARWLDLDLAASRRTALRSLASVALVPILGLVIILTSLATVDLTGPDHRAAGDHSPAAAVASN